MRILVAIAGLAVGLLSPIAAGAPSYAVGETCDGVPATIVGTPGGTVAGTAGPDVIVTHGAQNVDAAAGDDIICTTATVGTVQVVAGPGNDLIDRRGDLDPAAVGRSNLQLGQDALLGAPGADYVISNDGERDIISTGDGADDVFAATSLPTSPAEPDAIDLGPGDDHASVGESFSADMTVVGGDGDDAIVIGLPGSDDWVLDARLGTAQEGGVVRLVFGGFESYNAYDTLGHWRFVGTDSPEQVHGFLTELVGADLGGGDDLLSLFEGPGIERPRVDLDGGPGTDQLVAQGPNLKERDLSLDLRRGRLAIEQSATGRVERFENADVTGATVDVVGTHKADTLVARSCRVATIRGLGGDDRLTVTRMHYRSCPHVLTRVADGGGGNDQLTGSEDADRLVGGPGRDRADALGGRDRCLSIEVATSC